MVECAASFILRRFEDVIKQRAISLVVPLHQQRFINRKCFMALLAKQTFSADIQVEFFTPLLFCFSLYFLFILPYILYPSRLDRRFHGRGNAFQSSSRHIKSGWPSPFLPLCLSAGVSSTVILTGEQKKRSLFVTQLLALLWWLCKPSWWFCWCVLPPFLSAMLRINIYIIFHLQTYEDAARKQPHRVIFWPTETVILSV